jgi:hypothetical protein
VFRYLILVLSLILSPCAFAGVDFDGVDDYATIGEMGDIWDGVNGFSIMCWVNTDTDHNGIMISGDDTSTGERVFQFKKKSGGEFEMRAGDVGAVGVSICNSATSRANDVWHNLIGIFDGTACNLYVNGVLDDSDNGADDVTANDNPEVVLGDIAPAASTNPFNGTLSDCAIWSDTLTADEIAKLQSRVKGTALQIDPANLQAYWALDDGPGGSAADGDSIFDSTGNGNNGTGNDGANNTGMLWFSEEILSYR